MLSLNGGVYMETFQHYQIAEISDSEREKIVNLENSIKDESNTNVVLIAYQSREKAV